MKIQIDRIIRTNRKTIAIRVLDDGTIEVRAPTDVTNYVINKMVAKKESWIKKKMDEILSREPPFKEKEFVNGEDFLYLGKHYRLKIVENQDVPLKLQGYFLLSKEYIPNARELFVNWYKMKAYEKISERASYYSHMMGLKYNKLNITDAQHRWGSCSPKGNINFSWRLVMAPINAIDYVVVHELVHLRIKNHTKEFWNAVRVVIPDYRARSEWLKENGYLLRI